MPLRQGAQSCKKPEGDQAVTRSSVGMGTKYG